ncbi:MAG: SMI1/KNR4 family protein [Pseudomonadota bacterium]
MFRENVQWYKSEGASEFEITKLRILVNFELPQAYIELLRFSNGGEGSLNVQPLYFVLDSVENAISYFESEASKVFSSYFVFGGNGGGEFLAIEKQTGAVVSINSCNSNTEEVGRVARSFSKFLELVG